VLGFDVGSRRIGVAIGSSLTGARAVAVVDVHADGPDWTAIARLQAEWKPDGLVVGDPLTLDGQDQPNRKRARAFARQLRERFKLPVVMIDERSSSVEAARRFAVERAEGRKRRRDAAALDAVAAAVIVERWLCRRTTPPRFPDCPHFPRHDAHAMTQQLDSDGRLRHLLTLEGLPRHPAAPARPCRTDPRCRGRPRRQAPRAGRHGVCTLFFEPSTRTRSSFQLAAQRWAPTC
jgi:putative Holliday junction resolvase